MLSTGVSQGFAIFEAVVVFMKLKKVFRMVYLNRLVDCFWPSQSSVKKVRIVSGLEKYYSSNFDAVITDGKCHIWAAMKWFKISANQTGRIPR